MERAPPLWQADVSIFRCPWFVLQDFLQGKKPKPAQSFGQKRGEKCFYFLSLSSRKRWRRAEKIQASLSSKTSRPVPAY